MYTAEELFNSCESIGVNGGLNKKHGLKHFQLIINNLTSNERVLFSFIGTDKSTSQNTAYCITTKRILSAHKGLIGETVQSIDWNNVNDIALSKSAMMGIIRITTFKYEVLISVSNQNAQKIYDCVYPIFSKSTNTTADPLDEIKKLKELLDLGAITQEEFNVKKKELLGL